MPVLIADDKIESGLKKRQKSLPTNPRPTALSRGILRRALKMNNDDLLDWLNNGPGDVRPTTLKKK